jgi:hypothetical protein
MNVIARTSCPKVATAGCLLAGLLACLPGLSGCRESSAVLPGDVRSYRIPRQKTEPGIAASPAIPPGQESAGGLRLRYDVPEGWTDRGGGGLRLATLAVGDPADGQEVTVIPAAGTLADNVSRWQGQLEPDQEPPAAAAAVQSTLDAAETVDVDGVIATVVMLLDEKARVRPDEGVRPDDAEPTDHGQAILAAMIPLDETAALFVKYKGDESVARRERDRFVEFVRSIRWK